MPSTNQKNHSSDIGYKQTEVGVIPEDWEVRRVCELAKHGPKNGYSGRSGKDGQGTPTLSLSATSAGHLILNSQTVKYLEERISLDSDLFLRPGDILVQRSNTTDLVGTTAIFTGPTATFIYPDLMMRLRFKELTSANWFWRYANSTRGRRFFTSVAAGSTGSMPKISGEKLREMPVPWPPLPEQRAIAEALSDADALIESLEQLIAKKCHLKQGAMQELLTGTRRLPGFDNGTVGYKQTEVGMIPEDWVVVNLGAVARGIYRGASPRPIDDPRWFDEDSKIGWVRISDVTQSGRYLTETTQRLSQDGVRHSRYVPSGALIMSICATVGRPIETRIDTCIHDGFVLFDKPSVEQGFLYHILKDLEPRWANTGQTGSQMNLNTGLIKSVQIPLPSTKAEQEAIAEALSDMDTEVDALEAKIAKASQLKQGMMHNLLTGKIRLV